MVRLENQPTALAEGLAHAPRIFSIPSGRPFADDLARGLMDIWGDDPLVFARASVFLPTRRACRSLRDAFLRAADGQALILPRLVPLGDVDEEELVLSQDLDGPSGQLGLSLPPAVNPLSRRLKLARLVWLWLEKSSRSGPQEPAGEDQAVALADALARFLDQTETENLDFDKLAELVPREHAAHWGETLKFLRIITHHWPKIEQEEGAIGPARRRHLLTEAQVAHWRNHPPDGPVVVAGSTGSIPATALLMKAVLDLPTGLIVLPGLDLHAPDDVWHQIESDATHPQFGLRHLLQSLSVERNQVKVWSADPVPTTPMCDPDEGSESKTTDLRGRLLAAALWPAAATAGWPDWLAAIEPEAARDALSGLNRIDCAAVGEEAAVIALILRHNLETPGKTAALVTPDRGLARRVASEMARWDVALDDSAGIPLAQTPPGGLLRLLAEATAARWAPVPLLALLKHPLVCGGQTPGAFRHMVRRLETAVLHGPRPGDGLSGLQDVLAGGDHKADLANWLDGVVDHLAPLEALFQQTSSSLKSLLVAHLTAAEVLCTGNEDDSQSGSAGLRLWQGEAGEAAAAFCADLLAEADNFPDLDPRRYPAFLTGLMAGHAVRPRFGQHPRLAILGPLEARLLQPDLIILGGLNEGVWPAESDPGPWLSRPMMKDFGLPLPERRIGLSAHDFLQGCGAREVVLTRSTRIAGAPTVPSRWLVRLEALCKGLAIEGNFPGLLGQTDRDWRQWAANLDATAEVTPTGPPAPRPPVKARPRRLSVTRIETWMRDPYGLYAEQILRLRKLDPLDADPGAAEWGTLVHRALELFLTRYPDRLPGDPYAALISCSKDAFKELTVRPGLWTYSRSRFLRLAKWFCDVESERRDSLSRSTVEVSGCLVLAAPAGPFELTAKADRIDILRDGTAAILDYKTGEPPKSDQIALGLSPQLPLEGAIALSGGFPDLPKLDVSDLAFWRLTGGSPAGRIYPVKAPKKGSLAELIVESLSGLEALVALFDKAETPYPAVPRPEHGPRYSDYHHLARIKEWSSEEGEA
ncbi:MAG: double-strand break repair protein AddB [Pseudomonadota bacterium]